MGYNGTWDDLYLFLSILITIEDGMGIEITDAETGEIETIQDLVDMVSGKLSGER